jgi:hypothetical protein
MTEFNIKSLNKPKQTFKLELTSASLATVFSLNILTQGNCDEFTAENALPK